MIVYFTSLSIDCDYLLSSKLNTFVMISLIRQCLLFKSHGFSRRPIIRAPGNPMKSMQSKDIYPTSAWLALHRDCRDRGQHRRQMWFSRRLYVSEMGSDRGNNYLEEWSRQKRLGGRGGLVQKGLWRKQDPSLQKGRGLVATDIRNIGDAC